MENEREISLKGSQPFWKKKGKGKFGVRVDNGSYCLRILFIQFFKREGHTKYEDGKNILYSLKEDEVHREKSQPKGLKLPFFGFGGKSYILGPMISKNQEISYLFG